jgi:hypothetical protein
LVLEEKDEDGWRWSGRQELRECVGLRVFLQNKVSEGIRRCARGRGKR